jgi:hypothetical protein
MSVEVMTHVFKRYPEGGNERLLALAIADHARPDGTQVYPSVALLAEMTRQSERSVQRLMSAMLVTGWLQLVRKSTGRRGDTNEYRICPQWIAGGPCVPPEEVPDRRTIPKATGAKLAPVEGLRSVDNLSTTGDTQGLSGDTQGLSGDTAVSPNPSVPIPNQVPPLPPVETGGCGQPAKQPKPEARPPTSKERRRWRWADVRSGIDGRGQELGVAMWDQRLPSEGGEPYVAFAARVFAAHLAVLGVATSPGVVRRAMDATGNWSELIRQMAAQAGTTNPPRSNP